MATYPLPLPALPPIRRGDPWSVRLWLSTSTSDPINGAKVNLLTTFGDPTAGGSWRATLRQNSNAGTTVGVDFIVGTSSLAAGWVQLSLTGAQTRSLGASKYGFDVEAVSDVTGAPLTIWETGAAVAVEGDYTRPVSSDPNLSGGIATDVYTGVSSVSGDAITYSMSIAGPQGPEGPAGSGATNAVRFDGQVLTSAQQAAVRTTINALAANTGSVATVNLADGAVTPVKLGASGSASSGTYLAGDFTWRTPPGGADYSLLAALASGTTVKFWTDWVASNPANKYDAEAFNTWLIGFGDVDYWHNTPDAVVLTSQRQTATALAGTGIGVHFGANKVSMHQFKSYPKLRIRLANGVTKPLAQFPTLTISGTSNYTVTYTDAANSANTYSATFGPYDTATTLTTNLNAALPAGAKYLNAIGTAQFNGAAWAGSTAYALNAQVSNGGNVYKVTTAGTSASSGGPTGTGASITDGSVTWKYVSAAAGSMVLYSPQDRVWNITISAGSSTASLTTPSTNPMRLAQTTYVGTGGQVYEGIIFDANPAGQTYDGGGMRWIGYTTFDECEFYLPHGSADSPPGETDGLQGYQPLGGTVKNNKFYGSSLTALALGLSGDNTVGTVCTQTLLVIGNEFYGPGSKSHATANNNMGNVRYAKNRVNGFEFAYNCETPVGAIDYDDNHGVNCTAVYRMNKDGGGPSSASIVNVTVRNPTGLGTYAYRFDNNCDVALVVINDAVDWVSAPAWAPSTTYALNDVRSNGNNVYKVTTAGTSASSGGPTGTGSSITDGTVVWTNVGGKVLNNTSGTPKITGGLEFAYRTADKYRSSGASTLTIDPHIDKFVNLNNSSGAGQLVAASTCPGMDVWIVNTYTAPLTVTSTGTDPIGATGSLTSVSIAAATAVHLVSTGGRWIPLTTSGSGGTGTSWVTKTSSYTLSSTDDGVFVSGTGVTITLPSATTAGVGRYYGVKNTGSASVTVTATAGAVDNGSVGVGSFRGYRSDGTNWWTT